MNAVNYTTLSKEQLQACKAELEEEYAGYVKQNLKLDMSRGKPAGTQLDLTNGVLDALDNYKTADGTDARNYGLLDGIPEAKALFSELLNIPKEKLIIGGNSSLNICMIPWCASTFSERTDTRRGTNCRKSNSSARVRDTTAISESAKTSASK